jgi:4-amino-4-deoxy-L-arabinose transferase-like glycosyltransferase
MATTRSRMTEEAGEVALDPRGFEFIDRQAVAARRARALAWARSHPWVLVGLLALAGLAVRLLLVRGIWVDEAISVRQAHMSLPDMLQDLRRTDNHPPLFFVLLWGTTKVLGYSELAVRTPAIIAGTALVPALFATGRELFDRRTGLVAAALGACAPLAVWYSQEARMYALFMLLATLAVWAQVRLLRDGRGRWWLIYAALTIALLYTQYFSIIPVAIQQLAFVVVAWRRARRGQSVKRLLIGCWILWAALTLALLPLAPFVAQQFGHDQTAGTGFASVPASAGNPAGTSPSVYSLLSNLVWAVWGYHADSTMLRIAALWPLLMLLALALLGRRRSPNLALVGALALGPVLVLLVVGMKKHNLFEVRYFAGAVPMLLLLAARALAGGALRRTAALAAVGALMISMLVGLADEQLNGSNPRTYDFRGALAQIRREARPGDTLIYSPDYLQDVITYYAPHLRSRVLRDPKPRVPGHGGVFLLASFLEDPVRAAQVGAARKALARGPRRLVSRGGREKIDLWEFR